MSESDGSIVCRSHTTSRRHPKVVGMIGGHAMPWPSTNTQLIVLIGTAIFLLKTRAWWGMFLPGPLQLILLVGLPCLGWWAVRYWHPEGRGPGPAVIGGMNYVTRPKLGSIDGRAVSRRTSSVVGGGGCFYMGDDGA